MREAFQHRTGAFGPEDPWFEARSRAFWDDALTTQGLAARATRARDDAGEPALLAIRYERAHRGLFLAQEVDDRGARLRDLWSGAELFVHHLDEAQAVAFEHAEGAIDGRVIATPKAELYVLPGAFHHAPDALEPLLRVVEAARHRKMETGAVLDALLRMEMVFRSSSRVKAGFAYRVESLAVRA
ncbi:MAG: hypothetical protein KF819_27560 [Labilithrix sp.]|nr:hypothetical protein [Labilithrix sp.]